MNEQFSKLTADFDNLLERLEDERLDALDQQREEDLEAARILINAILEQTGFDLEELYPAKFTKSSTNILREIITDSQKAFMAAQPQNKVQNLPNA
jgi:hypothetical protein